MISIPSIHSQFVHLRRVVVTHLYFFKLLFVMCVRVFLIRLFFVFLFVFCLEILCRPKNNPSLHNNLNLQLQHQLKVQPQPSILPQSKQLQFPLLCIVSCIFNYILVDCSLTISPKSHRDRTVCREQSLRVMFSDKIMFK